MTKVIRFGRMLISATFRFVNPRFAGSGWTDRLDGRGRVTAESGRLPHSLPPSLGPFFPRTFIIPPFVSGFGPLSGRLRLLRGLWFAQKGQPNNSHLTMAGVGWWFKSRCLG